LIFIKYFLLSGRKFYFNVLRDRYVVFLLLLLFSCQARDINGSGYRLVGKNGKVIYFEKKRPQFNKEQLKKLETTKLENVNEETKKTKKQSEDKTAKTTQNTTVDSSAYTLKSVMDSVVKNEDINAIARDIETMPSTKTIKDFEYIPEVYFENVADSERLTVKQNQNFLVSKRIDKQRKLEEISTENSKSLVKNKYYVQLGSFKSKIKAEKLLSKYTDVGSTRQLIQNVKGDTVFYRVIIGVFNTNAEATDVKNKIIQRGHTDVFVFKN
jgi:cell division protein FtsN